MSKHLTRISSGRSKKDICKISDILLRKTLNENSQKEEDNATDFQLEQVENSNIRISKYKNADMYVLQSERIQIFQSQS